MAMLVYRRVTKKQSNKKPKIRENSGKTLAANSVKSWGANCHCGCWVRYTYCEVWHPGGGVQGTLWLVGLAQWGCYFCCYHGIQDICPWRYMDSYGYVCIDIMTCSFFLFCIYIYIYIDCIYWTCGTSIIAANIANRQLFRNLVWGETGWRYRHACGYHEPKWVCLKISCL